MLTGTRCSARALAYDIQGRSPYLHLPDVPVPATRCWSCLWVRLTGGRMGTSPLFPMRVGVHGWACWRSCTSTFDGDTVIGTTAGGGRGLGGASNVIVRSLQLETRVPCRRAVGSPAVATSQRQPTRRRRLPTGPRRQASSCRRWCGVRWRTVTSVLPCGVWVSTTCWLARCAVRSTLRVWPDGERRQRLLGATADPLYFYAPCSAVLMYYFAQEI